MKCKTVAIGALAVMMAIAPVSSALAHDHDHWEHGGPLVGLFALGAAVVVGTAVILTAPINALAGPPPQAYYGPPPGYYAGPPPGYYAQAPYYGQAPYYAQPRGVYAAPGGYYAQAPVYYPPPPGYYR